MADNRLTEARTVLLGAIGDGVEDLEIVNGGFTSDAFYFRHGDQELVLRLSRYRQNFEKDAIASKYGSSVLPIPKILRIGSAEDGYYAISERARGKTIPQLDVEEMCRVLPSLFETLDGLRDIDTSSSVGSGNWLANGNGAAASWRSFLLDENWAYPYVHGWEAVLAAEPAIQRTYRRAYEILSTSASSCPEIRNIVHADIYLNALFDEQRLTALFDWGSVMYGDYLYDLAWMSFWAPKYRATKTLDFRAEALTHYASIGLDISDFDARVNCYELSIGLDHLRFHAFAGHDDDLRWTFERLNQVLGTVDY